MNAHKNPPVGQLSLALVLEAPSAFENFITERDRAVIAHLKAAAVGQQGGVIWLSGGTGTGKTHLLQAVCREADRHGRRAMYLEVGDPHDPSVLDNLTSVDCLSLDRIDVVAGDAAWEAKLFSVFDHFHAGETVLVVAAKKTPSNSGLRLPDLASRAASGAAYRLHELDDAGQLEALLTHARFRGLELDSAAALYLLSRVRRGMKELCAWLDELDQRSLREQRRLTIPLIREALKELRDESSL